MKTLVVRLLVGQVAKRYMPKAEYVAFRDRLDMMRWQQIRAHWPEIWQDFSERFDAIKDQFSRGAEPQTVLTEVYPEGIKRYPELFEYFRLHKQEALAIAHDDPSILTDNGGLHESTGLSEGSAADPPSDVTDEGIVDVLRDLLLGWFE